MWAIIHKTTNKIHDKFYDKRLAETLLSGMSDDYKITEYPSEREIFQNGRIVMSDEFKDPFLSGKNGTKTRINIIDYEGKLFYFRIEDGYVAKVIEVGINGVY
mgnify:CR=1 FL=1